jgi:molybdopterin molybdotransferase
VAPAASEPIPVERALERLLDATPVLPEEKVPLGAAPGRVLAEEIRADADVPAFDKALMDGFAVRSADLAAGARDLIVVREIPAGTDPAALPPLAPGTAARIMTGAPLPPGADAVVPVEETGPAAASESAVRCAVVRPGDHRAARGADVRAGTMLLAKGDVIGAAEVAVLAACGRAAVRVGGHPRAAILATGDELVAPGDAPAPGRLHNSNGPMLLALAARAGAAVTDLGIAPDDPARLRAAVEQGLDADLLLISGGVSMGTRDFVGATLRDLGATILFDRVAIRPGKPFTAARRGRTIVCACPGNPASSYVIFQVFARAVLRRMAGHPQPGPTAVRGVLASAARQRPGRAGYWQARATIEGGRLTVDILATSGSADIVACARGNALVVLPAGTESSAAGDEVDVLLLDDHLDR